MKRFFLLLLLLIPLCVVTIYLLYLLKAQTLERINRDISKVTLYRQWGYDTNLFEKMYANFQKEAENTPFYLIPFRINYFDSKHDNILRLTQAGYATEVTKQKELVQSRLSYLRERVKNDKVISQNKKQNYSDSFEVLAGAIFETNTSNIGELKKALQTLEEKDRVITKEIEGIRKESLINELQTYKTTCQELFEFFILKNNQTNILIAQECLTEAEKLLGPGYIVNGADFIETLSRERVFTAVQKADQAKQQLIQDELYAAAAKKKEEEKLSVVPPSPRQEGKIIVVNLNLQRLYAYENGKTIYAFAVPITTGKYGFETVTGEFAIYLKEQHHKMVSPFPGIYYDDVVNYWMPFYLGYGLHDAPWRSIYGTQDYPIVGSHGCINIPLNETVILYNWAEVGTRVIVI